jgi:murein DD-endopeptidase MepM/ murein hydrolase activator NlpD
MPRLIILFLFLFLLPITINSQEFFSFSQSHYTVIQGETLRLDIKSKNEIESSILYFGNKKYQVFKKNSVPGYFKYYTLIGISKNQKPAKYKLDYYFRMAKTGEKYYKRFNIKVAQANFRKSVITLSIKKSKLLKKPKQLKREIQLLAKQFQKITRKPLFNQPFIKPCLGRNTTPFGAYRVVNGRQSGKHSGLDIANRSGTPVYASNSGIVGLVQNFKIHGKSIVIDHGLGIITAYLHLNRTVVHKGERVKRGQLIGYMGATGIATGTHLHWGISVQNTRINPLFWLKNPHLCL